MRKNVSIASVTLAEMIKSLPGLVDAIMVDTATLSELSKVPARQISALANSGFFGNLAERCGKGGRQGTYFMYRLQCLHKLEDLNG